MSRIVGWAVTVSGLIIVAAAAVGLFFNSSRNALPVPWSQFELYGIPSSQVSEEVRSDLAALDGAALSRYSATVWLQNFIGGEYVPIAELSQRLESIDPRMDPFMKSVDLLFSAVVEGQPYEVVYVPRDRDGVTDQVLPGAIHRLADAAGGGLTGPRPFLAGLAQFLSLVAVLWLVRSISPVGFTAAAMFSTFGAMWGSLGIVQGDLLFVGWLAMYRLLGRYLRVRAAGRQERNDVALLVPVGYATVAAILLSFGLPASVDIRLVHALVTAGLLVAAVVASAGAESIRLNGMDHPPFTPVRLLNRTYRERLVGIGVTRVWLTLVIVAFAPLSVGVLEWSYSGTGETTIPVPADSESLAGPDDRVSIGLYVAHRAYQQALPYGWEFSEPEPGDTVSLRRFSYDGQQLRAYMDPVIEFDHEWFRSVLEEAPPSTVYRLFVSEAPQFGFALESFSLRAARPRTTMAVFATLLLIVLPVSVVTARLRFQVAVGTVAQMHRRLRQEA